MAQKESFLLTSFLTGPVLGVAKDGDGSNPLFSLRLPRRDGERGSVQRGVRCRSRLHVPECTWPIRDCGEADFAAGRLSAPPWGCAASSRLGGAGLFLSPRGWIARGARGNRGRPSLSIRSARGPVR